MMGRIHFSLHTRLLLLVAAALLPALVLIVWQALGARAEAVAEAQRDAQRLAGLTAGRLERFAGSAQELVITFAAVPVVREAAPGACNQLLADIMARHSRYANIGVTDATGNLICSATPLKQAVSFSDRPWFREARDNRRFTISDFLVGRATGKPSIVFAIPLSDEHGRFRGTVFASLDLAQFAVSVTDTVWPDGTTISILDRKDTIVARYPDHEKWVGKPFPTEVSTALRAAGENTTVEGYGADGVLRTYVHNDIVFDGETQGILLAGIPNDSYLAPIDADLQRNLLWLMLIAAVCLAIAGTGGSLLLRRLRRLTVTARRFGEGDLTARSGLPGNHDEVGYLATAFDDMAGALEEREQRLEQSVREIRRLNRALRTLSAGNRVLTRAGDEAALLEQMCRAVVEAGGYKIAWVGYAEHDVNQTLRPMASAGLTLEDFPKGLTWADCERGRSPTPTAVRTGEAVVANDLLANSDFTFWHERFRAWGIGSGVALPLRVGGEIIGALSIFAAEADAFGAEEVELLAETADDLAYGIATLRLRARKTAVEAEVRESEQRLRFALETCNIGAWDIDLTDHTVFRSLEHDRIFGYPELLPQWTLEDFFGHALPEYHEPIRKMIEEATARQTGWTYECRIRRTDGEIRWIWFTGRHFTDSTGHHRVAGVVQDITERKQAEEEIRALNADLERRVAERTAELKQANAELAKASRLKSDFLASMSHELRTPLNAIIGFSELLKDGLAGEMTPKQKEYIENVFHSGEHLLSLINDILDLSKVEAGKMELQLEPISLPSLLEACLTIVKEKAMAHRIRLSLEVDPEIGEMQTDPRKLKQIVYNYLSNAVKFTPDGGQVTLSARLVPAAALPPATKPGVAAERYLEVAVTDSGIGIAEEDMQRLFQTFVQIDSSLGRKYEGTGLGLSLVKKLAALFGGVVGVESVPGKGARFSVWLPWEV